MPTSNPVLIAANKMIRNDPAGAGNFGASRDGGTRSHKGLDLLSNPGGVVNSPISGKVTKIGFPYDGDFKFRYVEVEDESGSKHRVFYVDPKGVLEVGSTVEKGSPMGIAQDVTEKFPDTGMEPHVHYEIKDSKGEQIDPATTLRNS